ncbi:zinc finger protein [Aphelenchoides avenae]|nr:zinc finger protein [Aphelenchus avenae]
MTTSPSQLSPTSSDGFDFEHSGSAASGPQGSSPPQCRDRSDSGSHGHSDSHHHNGEHHNGVTKLGRVKSIDTCRVCGDGPARMHYGVPTCFGCKGFFRRTLKRTKEYTCRYNNNCVVDRYERNSCRYCRFKRCLDVGMDPKAVRPDRDAAGRTHPIRHRRTRPSLGDIATMEEDEEDTTDDWVRKLPVDMRTLLMQIMNIELMVARGDATNEDPKTLYPLPYTSLRQILNDPTLLDGKRTEMRYDPYRQVQPDELTAIAHRRLIATIDTVDHLCALMDLHNTEDKVSLVKAAYAPLALFCSVAYTTKCTKDRNVLCLCCFGYVPRGVDRTFEEPYHLANRIVDRTLDELVEPFRAFNFKEQEVALMKAIIVLNPHLRCLSTEASEQVADLRDRIQETLYNVVRESHPKEVASSRFGNLLLFLPSVMMLGSLMYENLQFVQSFGKHQIDPLLGELLDNIEPVSGDGVNVDDVLSDYVSDHNSDHNGYLKQSESTASLSSLASHASSSASSFDYYYDRRGSDEQQITVTSASSLPSLQSQQPQQQQTLATNDSDPDYNLTLTADTFSGMRQAIQTTMDVDMECQQVATTDPGKRKINWSQDRNELSVGNYYSNGSCASSTASVCTNSSSQRPFFFLEPSNPSAQAQPTQAPPMGAHTVGGTKHVFTVERTRDPNLYTAPQKMGSCSMGAFQVGSYQAPSQLMQQQHFAQQQQMQFAAPNGCVGDAGSEQYNATISKSQSYPYFLAAQQQQQMNPPAGYCNGNYGHPQQ